MGQQEMQLTAQCGISKCKNEKYLDLEINGVTKPTTLPGSYTVVLDEPEKMIEDD